MKDRGTRNLIRSNISGLHRGIEKLSKNNIKLTETIQEKDAIIAKQTGLSKHHYLFGPTKYVYRDPIYGSIPLCRASFNTLNSSAMQRLRDLKQTGPVHYVYTGATHTRFSHSVGVYHLAKTVLQRLVSLPEGEGIEAGLGRALLAASLLHDVGHFPHSHILEELRFRNFKLNHEEASASIIRADPELKSIMENEWDVDPELVASLITKSNYTAAVPLFLKAILTSSIDIDKMDYLKRDAYHAGVPYGSIEHSRLIESMRIDQETQKLLISERGIAPTETVLFSKYLMFRNVYWHHTVRIISAMIKRCFLDFLLTIFGNVDDIRSDDRDVQKVLGATDDSFERTMLEILHNRGQNPPESFALFDRIRDRELFKRAGTYNCDSYRDLEARVRDPLDRRDIEIRMSKDFLGQSASPAPCDILIDIPERVDFIDSTAEGPPDPPDVFFEKAPPGSENVINPWHYRQYVSSFDAKYMNELEEGIRKIRFVCDPKHKSLIKFVSGKAEKYAK